MMRPVARPIRGSVPCWPAQGRAPRAPHAIHVRQTAAWLLYPPLRMAATCGMVAVGARATAACCGMLAFAASRRAITAACCGMLAVPAC